MTVNVAAMIARGKRKIVPLTLAQLAKQEADGLVELAAAKGGKALKAAVAKVEGARRYRAEHYPGATGCI